MTHRCRILLLSLAAASAVAGELARDRLDALLSDAHLVAGIASAKHGAKWLWTAQTKGKQRCYFQRIVTLDKTPNEAWLYARGDNGAQPFINGQRVGMRRMPGAPAWSFLHANVTESLRTGVNTVAFEVVNSDGPGGLVAVLEMRHGRELTRVASDSSWSVTEQKPRGWPGTTPAQWVWAKDMRDRQHCYFQRVVDLPAKPTAARLYGRGDDSLAMWVNGKRVTLAPARGSRGYDLGSGDVTALLKAGRNVVSAEVRNGPSWAGLISVLDVKVGDSAIQFTTDTSWRVTEKKPKAWPAGGHDEPVDWQPVRVVVAAGEKPWGYIGGYPAGSGPLAAMPPPTAKWAPARELGPADMAPWRTAAGYPAPNSPEPPTGDARTQVAFDWLMQDRHALKAKGISAKTFAALAEEHLSRAEKLAATSDYTDAGSPAPHPSASPRPRGPQTDRERPNAEGSPTEHLPSEAVAILRARCAELREATFTDAARGAREGLSVYLAARQIKRDLAFTNPLLDFDELLFVKQLSPSNDHEQSHRLGVAAFPGGGMCILKGLRPDGELRSPTEGRLPVGNYWRADLSFDAKKILFCYRPPKDRVFHIYEAGIDGSGLRQITRGPFDDLDPIYLPGGRIMFSSTRGLTYVRCNPESRAFVLCTMNADGSDIKIVSHNNECDWTPCLMPDGRVLYTRWEYTDRALWRLQKLWTVNPDGTGTRVFWGNHGDKPDCLAEARPVPNSDSVVFCAVGHHYYFLGSLALVNPRHGLDYPQGLTKLTPELAWPEVEPDRGRGAYKSPFPLSEQFFIVSYSHHSLPYLKRRGGFGIYLLDAFGNKELIYRDPKLNSYYAIPVKPRRKPPVVKGTLAKWAERDSKGVASGALFNPNVYAGLPGVKRGAAKFLRVIEQDYKTYSGRRQYMYQCPPISMHFVESVKRVLGTVPVEPDGSVFFKMPAGLSVYFQLLDENHMAIQTMRSFVGVQPGEVRGCSGCHEGNSATPVSLNGAAMRRAPAELTRPVWGTASIGYERLVQPVLDKHCVSCHSPKGAAGKKLDLTFHKTKWFAEPYKTLIDRQIAYVYPSEPAYWKKRARDVYAVAKPYEYLSPKSKLVANAGSGRHHGVKVGPAELRQLIAWIDTNGPYNGVEEVRRMKRFASAPVSTRP